jgi:hypothetical protein
MAKILDPIIQTRAYDCTKTCYFGKPASMRKLLADGPGFFASFLFAVSGPVTALRSSGPMGIPEQSLVRVSELSKFGVGPRHMGIPAFWYWWVVVLNGGGPWSSGQALAKDPEMPNSQSLLEEYGSSKP